MRVDYAEETHEESVFSGDGGVAEEVGSGEFRARVLVDSFNGRLNVLRYEGDIDELAAYLREKAQHHELTKISLKATEDDWERFIPFGYVMEAILKHFYSGEHAYFLGRFFTRERRFGEHYEEEDGIMQRVRKESREPTPAEEAVAEPGAAIDVGDFRIEAATADDAEELARLYETVFDTYPTPMNDGEYIVKLMRNGSYFRVARTGGRIAGAASAAVDLDNHAAEMTDCATLPAFRGNGLMRHLVSTLEADLASKQVGCLYGMARALSYGMNAVFRKLGYTYQGRLTNHCHIMGSFEDMSLWVKRAHPSYLTPEVPWREESYESPRIP